MAGFLFKLETVEGTPAEPSSFSSAVPNWGRGETIHFGHKTMRVVAVRGDDSDEVRVLARLGSCLISKLQSAHCLRHCPQAIWTPRQRGSETTS